MCKLQDKAQHLEADLAHLVQEMNRVAYTTHPANSAARQHAKLEFRELEATYHSKVQQLAQLGHSLVLASLTDQVDQAAARMEWGGPPVRRVPSAAGGARYVVERAVLKMMVPGFYQALSEWGGVVVSERPCPRSTDSTLYTISLDCVNELFELGAYMVMNHYAAKVEGGHRG